MKKIQIVRLETQLLFVALTVTALLMQFPVIKLIIILTIVLGGVFYCGWACPVDGAMEYGFVFKRASGE